MKILVADDSRTNLMLITDSLQRLGHEVMAASSGEEAVSIFETTRPDLIILDVVMNGMDGFDCAKKIRDQSNEDWIPIIFLSSSVDDSSIVKGINAGGDDYLAKPFSEITLQAKIKAMQRIAEMRNRLFVATQELLVLSSTDTLTGIYNRYQFEKSLKEKLSEADRQYYLLALMFLDLDKFKEINDTIGHHIGDLLLKEATKRIKSCIRIEDFFARIGGDEFVIILSNIKERGEAGQVAQKIISNFIPPFNLEGHAIRISVSIGIACYPDKKTTHESFVQNADIAMYHAKSSGRSNYQYYTAELNEKYQKQISLEQDLKSALGNHSFILSYQPIYNLLTKKVISIEALLFWQHPIYGFISPNIFISTAEESGLIVEIGLWMLKRVCEQGKRWYSEGYDGKLFIDVSLHQFSHESFSESVNDILKETNFPAKMLELELKESSIITSTSNTSNLKNSLKKLYEMGVSIAINDFSASYSSLTTLCTQSINTLKINKIFLNNINMMNDSKNSIILKSLITLGNNLNLDVIAEGIRTAEQLQFLVLNGCLKGQGDLLGDPLSAVDMTKLLKMEKGY